MTDLSVRKMEMTTTDLTPDERRRVFWFAAELFRREPLFAGAALCLLVSMAPTLFALAADTRTLLGINVWIKPLKFEVALTIYLATLAWFAGWLPRGTTRTWWYRAFSAVVVLCVALEMVWIAGSAANGIASHFNIESPLMAGIYGLMGVLAVTLTSATLLYAWLIARNPDSRLDPVFRTSVVLGLVLTFVLTVTVAGSMAGGTGHRIGGDASDAGGFPFMGWVRDGGDLRVAHFFATHAMHFVPAFGFVAARFLEKRPGHAAVLAFSVLFTAFVGFTFVQARMGQPFLPAFG